MKQAQKLQGDLQGRSWGCTDLGPQPCIPSHPSIDTEVQLCTPQWVLGQGKGREIQFPASGSAVCKLTLGLFKARVLAAFSYWLRDQDKKSQS